MRFKAKCAVVFGSSLLGLACVSQVASGQATIQNPSFETVSGAQSSTNTLNTTAGNITNWTESINGNARYGSITSGSAFAPGTPPDLLRVAGLGSTSGGPVGIASISQALSGFDNSHVYAFTYAATSRTGNSANLQAFFDGTQVRNDTPAAGTTYVTYQTPLLTTSNTSPTLQFLTSQTGDNSVFFDNVQVRTFTSAGTGPVKNGSFEMDPRSRFDGNGYGSVGSVVGWNGASGLNVTQANGQPAASGNPFADNGTAPAPPANSGDDAESATRAVLFKQGSGDITQTISGLVVGQQYTLTYAENSRTGSASGTLTATTILGGTTLIGAHLVSPVGGTNPYTIQSTTFTVTSGMLDGSGNALLDFNSVVAGAGSDRTLLLDNVSLVPEPASLGLLCLGAVGLMARPRRA